MAKNNRNLPRRTSRTPTTAVTPVPDDALLTKAAAATSIFRSEYATPVLERLLSYASGGTFDNPMAFEGYGQPYVESIETCRLQLRFPVIVATRSAVCDPVTASSWNYENAFNTLPDALAKEMIAGLGQDLDPLRRDFVTQAIAGRDYGRAGGELVWAIKGRKYRLVELRPLSIFTPVYAGPTGDFAGLGPPLRIDAGTMGLTLGPTAINGIGIPGLPAPYKSWLYVYDREPGYPTVGRPWLRACRDAWRDWLDAAQQLQKLVAKISGIVLVAEGPTGLIPGTNVTYQDSIGVQMQDVANRGAIGIYLPTVPLPLDLAGNVDYVAAAAMANWQPVKLDRLDFGTNSPAIASVLQRMAHDEELMVLASGRSARTMLEGARGTHSETSSKIDSATIISELLNDDIAHQMQPVVDAWVTLNYGEQYRGAIRITCPPLDTTKQLQRQTFMSNVLAMTNPALQAQLLATIGAQGVRQYLEDMNFRVAQDFDLGALSAAMAASARPQASTPAGPMPADPLAAVSSSALPANAQTNVDKAAA